MSHRETLHKTGIRRKVILIICSSTLTVMVIGVGLAYLFGFNAMHNAAGDVNRKLSLLLATQVSKILDEEIGRIRAYSDNQLWKDEIIRSNSKYETMGKAAARAYLIDMDNKWAKTGKDSSLAREYLNNNIALELKKLAESDKSVAAISLIDNFGGLVAASAKTRFFFRPDERWNDEKFAGKKSALFIGDIAFDESANAWVVPVVFLIKDQSGNVMGALKADLAAERFFAFLGDFRVESTGHAVCVNGKGNIMFHPGLSRTNVALCSEKDYKRLLTGKRNYGTVFEPNFHEKQIFTAFSEVSSPYLLENGVTWRVFVDQDVKEVFAPLGRIVFWSVVAIIFLMVIMIPIGFVFSGFLVKPIQDLQKATAEIAKGNWDYGIDVKTGDEIEQFADVYKEMISTIKNKQEELLRAKEKLEELSKAMEAKVLERTKNLTAAKDEIDEYAKELERALMVKSDFVSMVSHELRTPLAAIKGALAIILDEKVGPITDDQKEFLNTARKNVDRLTRLINDVLDLQKLEQDKAVLNIKENDINEIVKEVVNTMGPLAGERELELAADLENDLPRIKFDKDRITQVLTNLVSNAVKFTEKGGVEVITSRGDNFIQVSVKDSGPGIQEEDMTKLFQKFVQLEIGLERKAGGTGLGLIIAKDIIEKHKGRIWVESKFGVGTTFHFVLPIKERRVLV